ncbi:MAG: BREX system P-loop protein BrxC, partial [Atopostipes sp.]|nr:BREX system P-loop protein BrxC [Atopostipes sp.]
MLIKDMFTKPINRDIKGVVKVGQDEEAIMKQELEEYVVTKELQKHFRDFFSSYKNGVTGQTDKMGVWISGFFGSGKSHFLKILSYLLENKQIDGKNALDYFIEDEKIEDSMVMADMKLASSVSTDTILFNIDSQSETSGGKDKNSILNVFLKVFNEKLGYSPNPHLAELERELDESGIYEDFQNKYKEITNEEWEDSRHKFNFLKDKVIQALVEIDFMSESTADDWARGTVRPYQLSINQFAEMINKYIEKQGDNHHIVFLVDEMGQYVGDDTDLMLNLQTITEDLGTMCQGKAWVVVTSQQDIDSITEVVGNDFSKIQGRFNTRLSLTSANVDEVIKLRILDKTDTANQTLAALYENKETIIKNLIIFNDGIEKKLYENKEDFAQVYPFIPYQFNILSSVLTSIRKYGASGKHLSEGERSMLALFKESAEKLKDEEHGAIIPFNIFYGALNQFLDHSHSVVISKALDNKMINPDREEDNFNVNVLKTLFMIKYVKEIEANLENITTLMVSSIDQDRIVLKEKVENALKILVKQTLVQKNGKEYIFLTDEEQEINREIESQNVQSSDMIRKVSDLIFADIFPDDRIQVPGKPQYVFPFNRSVDDQPYGSRQNFDYGVKIITPYSSLNGNESTLKMQSVEGDNVFVELPNDADFLEELRTELQIGKFLNSPSARNIPNFEEIRAVKGVEMKDHHKRGKMFLESALSNAKFYVNGDVLNLSASHFKNNLTKSLERVVEMVYHKLDYITDPMENSDIYKLFKVDDSNQLDLGEVDSQNPNAIRDVLDYIQLMTQSHATVSLKEIKNRFNKAPYGFLDSDIEWIIAKAFTDGSISLSMHGKEVSFITDTNDKIIDYITKNKFSDKLLIEEKEKISDREKKALKEINQELFQKSTRSNDSDRMIMDFKQEAQKMKEEL